MFEQVIENSPILNVVTSMEYLIKTSEKDPSRVIIKTWGNDPEKETDEPYSGHTKAVCQACALTGKQLTGWIIKN